MAHPYFPQELLAESPTASEHGIASQNQSSESLAPHHRLYPGPPPRQASPPAMLGRSISRGRSPEPMRRPLDTVVPGPSTNNLLSVPPSRRETGNFGNPPRRSATLVTLLDLDNQTKGETLRGATLLSSASEEAKTLNIDRQQEGKDIYVAFETYLTWKGSCRLYRSALNVYQTLLAFHNAIRNLGSTWALLKEADTLRGTLLLVLELFHQHAARSFNGVDNSSSRIPSIRQALTKRQYLEQNINQFSCTIPTIASIPQALKYLASRLEHFLERMNDVSEFAEENLNLTVDRCTAELRYRSSSLEEFIDRFDEPDVALYVNEVAGLVGEQLVAVDQAIGIFVLEGVPIIRRAQDLSGTSFQNLSTTSTLLSAVTAAALQYTFSDHSKGLAYKTNMLWIISLSFSIASAIHSQLAYYWIRHLHRTPTGKMTTIGSLLIVRAPLAFFVVSAVCFSGGLIAFSFLEFSSTGIGLVTTACTAITLGTLMLVVVWLINEKWESLWTTFQQVCTNGWKVISDAFVSVPRRLQDVLAFFARLSHVWFAAKRGNKSVQNPTQDGVVDLELGGSPTENSGPTLEGSIRRAPRIVVEPPPQQSEATVEIGLKNASRLIVASALGTGIPAISMQSASSFPLATDPVARPFPPRLVPPPISILTPVSEGPGEASATLRPPDALPPVSPDLERREVPLAGGHVFKFSAMRDTLRSRMKASWKLWSYHSSIRQLAFSPDGSFLASCAVNNTAHIFEIDPKMMAKPHHVGECRDNGGVGFLSWCPDPTRRLFVTVFGKKVVLWGIGEGETQKWCLNAVESVELLEDITCLTWNPNGESFYAASGSTLHLFDLWPVFRRTSDPITIHASKTQPVSFKIVDLAMIDDSRVWILVEVMETASSRQPLIAAERRLLDFNLTTKAITDQIPFVHPVKHLVIATQSDNVFGVVSFSNKAPSQLIHASSATKMLTIDQFRAPNDVAMVGRTGIGRLCASGAPAQIVIGADQGMIPSSQHHHSKRRKN
ncbi:hypothetical protein DL93DRAFT_2099892 [Clavulina sp. PMI_390]|nr:hypothetical protein DL93DRAFT_2099892 [Clavulina sp. PMI_390]